MRFGGVRAKVRFVARELFPSRSYMRAMMPVARKGLVGLLFAYCRRLVWLCANAASGFRAWRESLREADRVSRESELRDAAKGGSGSA
jgi:hypothetical protein